MTIRIELPRKRAVQLVLFCAVSLGAPACKQKVNTFAPPPPPAVTVAHPVERTVARHLESTGTTEAFQSVDLRARVPGFLEEVKFKPGAPVKKGDLLFVIDRRTYQATVDRTQAKLLADEAALKVAEWDAKLSEELAAQRAGSEIDRVTKTGKRDSVRAEVEASRAVLQSAKLDLEFCEVRAPIDGRITKNLVDVGNLVGASGQSTVLATIVSSRPLYVSLDVSESDTMMVRRERLAHSPTAEPGEVAPREWRAVDLATADQEDFTTHGNIDYVDPALNPQTGTLRVRCRFENADENLLPGMFVRLRVRLREEPALLVPDLALLSDPSGRYALVVDDKDVVVVQRVEIGGLDGALRVVTAGLSTQDRVVVNGLQSARAGKTVKPTLLELDAAHHSSSSGVSGDAGRPRPK